MNKIKIEIDENACVGCGLCVDTCPTEVFEMTEIIKTGQEKRIAMVKKVNDCIECLSCTYICPATAVECKDVSLVKNFYRKIETIEKMEKFLLVAKDERLTLKSYSKEVYQSAQKELFFLIGVLSKTLPELVGRAVEILGRSAGEVAAKQMPLYFEEENKNLQVILATLQKQLGDGWKFQFEIDEDKKRVILTLEKCFIRKIFQIHNQEPTSDICSLFHVYLGGIVGGFLNMAAKTECLKKGDVCEVRMEMV